MTSLPRVLHITREVLTTHFCCSLFH